MKYKHIIFDIDGTLLDSKYADLHGLQDTLKELKNEVIDMKELTFALGIPSEVALNQLGIKDIPVATKLWNTNLMKYSHTIRLFDGIRELLPELCQKGYRLGIVTSKNPQEFANDFVPQQIDHYFDTVLCVTDSPRPKPYGDPIITYLERTQILPEEAIYIGDTIYDYQCATHAGIDFGLALWGCMNRENIHARYYLDSPKDILTI